MVRRTLVLPVLVALLTAGCLGGVLDPVSNASTDETLEDNATGEVNRTSTDGTNETSQESDGSEDGSNSTEEQRTASGNDTGKRSNGTDEADTRERPPWPSVANATIQPGVRVTGVGQCTSNFLFRTPDNATLMLGAAAHCFAQTPPGGATSGCSSDVEPLEPGAEVEIENASRAGTLVYSSWWTMQQMEDPSQAACQNNDFALVAVDPADRGRVHPAVQGLGGPTGLAQGGSIEFGDRVEWYGNTALTPAHPTTKRHEGTVTASFNWTFHAYSAAPGLPGDSGSGILLENGSAAGVLVTVRTVPPGANGAVKLAPALSFANANALAAELVTWPQFEGGGLPASP